MSTLNSVQEEERVPILVVGDAAVPTGFARVVEGIFLPLTDRFEIHQLGTNYFGDPHELPWKVYPASVGGGTWGTHRLNDLVTRIKPKLIFVINDIWIANDYMTALQQLDSHPPVILYCPIDSGPIEREAVLALEGVKRLVTYTQFGKTQLDQAIAEARDVKKDLSLPNAEVIPHGVDTADFRVLEETDPRKVARAALFPDREDLLDAFIVLNANRNQPRKRIDATMEGFAMFAKNKPDDVKLYLHMGASDQGWDIPKLARRLGIEARLLMSTNEALLPKFTKKHLNHVYNACDVGLNNSYAEGWGLVSFEHGATRTAQIVPGFGPCEELWKDNALLLDGAFRTINQKILTEGWLITPEAIAEALEAVYNDPALREDLAEKAFRLSTSPQLSWSQISDQWTVVFQSTLLDRED